MAYTFLDNSLNTIGVLTNKGGQTNDYWGDSITHEIATSQDVLTSVSLSVDKPSVNIDTSGNQKTWNHVIQGLSFGIDGIGRKVNENDYLIYQEGTNGKYYLMAITQVDESAVQSGFHYKTVQGLNAAAYDLSRKTLRAKSFAQIPDNTQEKGTAQNILKYIFDGINWDVRTIGSFGAVDYDITEGTTAQAVLLDIIGMFEAEVDAYVQLNNWGKGANVFNKNGSIKRIFDFSTSLGKYRGETIRYDKNMVSITKTGARDSMYTKLYVNGNNITIADVNNGSDFIVDDVANRKYNKLGAVSTPVTYLEGIITNSAIESPTALLAWGKKQLNILNHPRYNYQISAVNDDKVQLGDTVIIQDTHASDPIYLKSKVISKSVSLADPVNNSFIVGEFSPIVIGADNGLEDTDQIMQLVNQANQTAINAQNKANENTQKIEDTRTDLEKTIDQKLQEGKDYSDSLAQKQKEAYNKFELEVQNGLAEAKKERDEISKKADDMLVQANTHAQELYEDSISIAKQEGQNAINNAQEALEQAKIDLNGGISANKVEITNTQKELATKVSQSDFDKKTGDLETQYTNVSQKADGIKVDVDSYKQTNDEKVQANQTQITVLSNELDSKVSQTNYDKDKQTFNTQISDVNQKADGIKASVTDLTDQVNSMGQVNQLTNTEFSPDLQGWSGNSTDGKHDPYRSYLDKNAKATTVGFYTLNADTSNGNYFSRFRQSVPLGTSSNGYLSISWQSYLPEMADNMYGHLWVLFHDADGNSVFNSTGANPMGNWVSKGQVAWERQKMEKIEIPQTATEVTISFEAREEIRAYLAHPMLVFGETIGSYVPGNYNNNARVTALELDVNGIHGTVNDPKKGLSATWDLANQGQTIAVQANTAAKTADGKAVNAQKDATTAITTANGTQTTVTSMQKDVKDLQSTTTQTAGQVTTEIEDRKNGDKSVVTQMTGLIDQRLTDTKKGYESAISQSADNIMLSVSTPNRFVNTDFSPNLDGWNNYNNGANGKNYTFYRSYLRNGATVIGINVPSDAGTDSSKYYSYFEQDVAVPGNNGGTVISLSWDATTNKMDYYANLWINFKKSDGSDVDKINKRWDTPVGKGWQTQKWENISVPKDASYIHFSFQTREGGNVYLSRPMLTFTSTAQSYMPGAYSNVSTNSVLQLQSDYFSLNLHTNSGDIVSSINGDHSGVTITGKHITLDGDVNVTGDFYAKGGNFKNLNAANITGDIATFIKSGFNDAFGSYTTLDAKGMQISTGGGVTQYSGQYAWFYNYNGSTLESIGRFGSSKSPWNPNNVDYMEIAVSTWRGAAQGGAKGNGGDGIMFAAYDPDMNETRLLTWETSLSAGYHGLSSGWNFWDNINFNGNKIVVPSADWHVSFSGMTLGQTGSTYPSIVEANEHKTGISFGLHEVYLLIDGKSYPMSPKIK